MLRYRVSKEKEGQDRAAQSHRKSTVYKCILRNFSYHLLNKGYFVNKRVKPLNLIFVYHFEGTYNAFLCKCILDNVYGPTELL